MTHSLSLSEVKARLSEVVREVRASGEETIITVDGRPAARIVPVQPEPRRLSAADIAIDRALSAAIGQLARAPGDFDAVHVVGEGRR
ncbi:MAG: type II toxin-antitoxin system Phd/YefM family antitoxin [Myxococcales bacterium]|nr:type II toxin-antitoxin system Phd/YefM family antitoxin [Myxococcales bacterium]